MCAPSSWVSPEQRPRVRHPLLFRGIGRVTAVQAGGELLSGIRSGLSPCYLVGMQSPFRQAALAIRDGRFSEAEETYRSWMRMVPESPSPRYGLSALLLARGAYAEGWPLYEARTEVPETGITRPRLSFPEWCGEEVKSLLVWPEQGLGDQIMFARFVPALVSRGVQVSLLTPPPLVRLFEGLGADIIAKQGEVRIPRHDAWCLIGSLPRLIGTIPSDPYLPTSSGGAGIGVMASGNPSHVNDANRSLPPEFAAQLRAMGRDLAPEATGAKDFADTAAIIRDLAMVISVDTAVAHLAGAMGKPAAVLLPYRADWRWGREGERSIWYPSARLVRQRAPGDWPSVFAQVRTS